MEARHRDKLEKYAPLCSAISQKGWKVNCFAVEVSARGFCSESLRFCFRSLGFRNKEIKSSLKSLSKAAVEPSFVIWLSRDSKVWDKDFVESSLETEPNINTVPPVTKSVFHSTFSNSFLSGSIRIFRLKCS